MDIDVSIGEESLTLKIENPYRYDISYLIKDIISFGSQTGIDLSKLEIEKLIPKMVKGVAGCESGCPANAKALVRERIKGFTLSYIEGGILSAVHTLQDGTPVSLKIFPEFN